MIGAGNALHGNARVAAIGLGHTLAYTLGAMALGVVLRRRLGEPIFPRALPVTAVSAGAFAFVAWLVHRELEPTHRVDAALFLIAVGAVGGGLYLVVLRTARRAMATLRADRAEHAGAGPALDDPDVALEP